MKFRNVLAEMPRRKTRNNLPHARAVVLLALCGVALASSEAPAKDVVTPCEISMTREAKEADFVVLYKFEVKDGKATNVKKVMNDFLKDDDFVACIARWILPSLTGQGLAEFSYKHAEGWTEITVSGKGFKKSFHFNSNPKQSGDAAGQMTDSSAITIWWATVRPSFAAAMRHSAMT